jgi:UDP-N-acetylmuramate--alanine ligase
VVTNAELDHHTTYASSRDVDETFARFLALAEHQVVPPELVRLAPDATTFGSYEGELRVPGAHNRRNAAAALKAIELAGEQPGSLADFEGAGRRFEDVGSFNGARIVDDYAHHPTEVKATIDAAHGAHRIVALFQPHLYSRTQREATAFGRALAAADVAVILDIYPAREKQSDYPGVTGLLVAQATADAAGGKRVVWARTHENARNLLTSELREGDLLLTMGAGDVNTIGRDLAARAEAPTQ